MEERWKGGTGTQGLTGDERTNEKKDETLRQSNDREERVPENPEARLLHKIHSSSTAWTQGTEGWRRGEERRGEERRGREWGEWVRSWRGAKRPAALL